MTNEAKQIDDGGIKAPRKFIDIAKVREAEYLMAGAMCDYTDRKVIAITMTVGQCRHFLNEYAYLAMIAERNKR